MWPKRLLGRWLVIAGLACLAAAWWSDSRGSVQAEVRRVTPQDPDQHFKSGGRISETVLQEMLVVLKRIDERLARLEQAAAALPATVQTSPARASEAPAANSPLPPIQIRRGR